MEFSKTKDEFVNTLCLNQQVFLQQGRNTHIKYKAVQQYLNTVYMILQNIPEYCKVLQNFSIMKKYVIYRQAFKKACFEV